MRRLLLTSALACSAATAVAQELAFPADANQNARRAIAQDSLFLPTAPFDSGDIPGITAEGAVVHTSWKVGDGGLTTLHLLASLRDQLIGAGFEPIYECDTSDCGGFDFRYGIDVLPEPDMHVNLGDFRYFAAQRPTDGDMVEYVALVVSRSANSGFVQLSRVGESGMPASFTASTKAQAPDAPVIAPEAGPIVAQLETKGHATLADLTFGSGSSTLGDGSFKSLADLAAYLRARPDRTVMLVGHTDAEGALAVNVRLSRSRAVAVMERLVEEFGVSRDQVSAEGVGYLAPRASNLTPDGRTQNRRVEVILTSTQ